MIAMRVLRNATGGLLLFALVALFWLKRTPPVPQSKETVPVAIRQPVATFANQIFANGVFEGNGREVALQFELVGRIVSIHVDESDHVQAGQVLARIDPAIQTIELAQARAKYQQAVTQRNLLLAGKPKEVLAFAEANARSAHAAFVNAKHNYDRMQELSKNGSAAIRQLDDANAQLTATRANYEAALAKVNEAAAEPRKEELDVADAIIALESERVHMAESMLSKTELIAPCDGTVIRRLGESGELVSPETGRPLLVMVDSSERRVRCFVEELDAVHVRVGSDAYVEADGLPGERFPGRVIRCTPYMTTKTVFNNRPAERHDVKVREVLIELDDSNDLDRLFVGLPLDAFIARETSDPM